MRILAIDIETRPALAYVWSLWDNHIGVEQVVDPGGVLCFAARWVGEKGRVEFWSDLDGHDVMIQRVWELLDETDAVLHYNGVSFDVPHLQREFMEAHKLPPAPFKQIDLLKAVKAKGRFLSNKLAHVAPQLGLKGKVEHEGFGLWKKCIAGDEKAWRRMRRYNIRDITELEKLYFEIRPWIPGHPSFGAHSGLNVCPKCGSGDLESRGFALTTTGKYQRYRCGGCGAWSRNTHRVEKTEIAQVTD